jgi:hypothetical protein
MEHLQRLTLIDCGHDTKEFPTLKSWLPSLHITAETCTGQCNCKCKGVLKRASAKITAAFRPLLARPRKIFYAIRRLMSRPCYRKRAEQPPTVIVPSNDEPLLVHGFAESLIDDDFGLGYHFASCYCEAERSRCHMMDLHDDAIIGLHDATMMDLHVAAMMDLHNNAMMGLHDAAIRDHHVVTSLTRE